MQKNKPIRDKKYIEFVRSLPCCVCGYPPPTDPHHYQQKGQGGTGTKVSDYQAVPLCHHHHVEYHNIGRQSFIIKHEVDFEALMERMNKCYTNLI